MSAAPLVQVASQIHARMRRKSNLGSRIVPPPEITNESTTAAW
ncbi:hypothetical protein [Actinopolyspora alba]|nr:hypothetical protein [Actinopolyspora alba]